VSFDWCPAFLRGGRFPCPVCNLAKFPHESPLPSGSRALLDRSEGVAFRTSHRDKTNMLQNTLLGCGPAAKVPPTSAWMFQFLVFGDTHHSRCVGVRSFDNAGLTSPQQRPRLRHQKPPLQRQRLSPGHNPSPQHPGCCCRDLPTTGCPHLLASRHAMRRDQTMRQEVHCKQPLRWRWELRRHPKSLHHPRLHPMRRIYMYRRVRRWAPRL
jgi:hypothetical protein